MHLAAELAPGPAFGNVLERHFASWLASHSSTSRGDVRRTTLGPVKLVPQPRIRRRFLVVYPKVPENY